MMATMTVAALTARAEEHRHAAVWDQDRRAMPVVAEEIPVIEMVEPLPGFPGLRRFALVRLDDEGLLCALRCLDDPELRFLVVPPGAFFDDYAPVVDDEVVLQLGIESDADILLLVVVNAADSARSATANLMAPVLVNTRNLRGRQVLLSDDLPIRAPLVA